MAPERFNLKGKMNAESSDIYAIGVILYECLTGRPPFIADNPELTIRMIIDHQPPDPRTLLTGISRDIVTICLKCLRKKPTDRYQSANDLADDLNRFISGVPVHARPIGITKRLLLWSDKNRSLAAATFTSLILLFTMIIMGVQFTMTQKQLRMQSDVNAEIARETALQLKIESDQTRNFMYGSITKFAEIIRDLSAVNSQTDAIKLLERVKLANNQLIHGYLSRSSISENNLKGSKIETLFRDGTNVIYLLNMKETGLQTLNRIYEKALNCKKDDPDHQLLMKYGTLSAHVMAMTYLSSNDPQSAMNILTSAWKSFCLVIKSQAPDFYDLNSRKSLLEELIKLNTNQDIQNRLKEDEIRAVNDEINQLTTMINSLEVENGTH
jgi:serine/threonine protein kinase